MQLDNIERYGSQGDKTELGPQITFYMPKD